MVDNVLQGILQEAQQVQASQDLSIKKAPIEEPLVVSDWLDADTVVASDGGPNVRLQGFDAPEVAKWVQDRSGEWVEKTGTAGGLAALGAVKDFATKHGYTEIKDTGIDAAFGRRTGRLVNHKGEDFITKLLTSGVFEPVEGVTKEDLTAIAVSKWMGDTVPRGEDQVLFDELAAQVNAAREAEGYDATKFKELALNEQQYAANPSKYLTDTVMFRHKDRNLKNQAYNPFSSSVGAAMVGFAEASYGVAEMLGDTLGLDSVKEFGENGVYRKGTEMANRAQVLLDYQDVDSAGDAWEFVSNNAGMSLPYMAMSTASLVAAPYTGGLSLLVPASVYAGSIWNEQADNAKNWALAVGGGAIQGALDLFGVTKLIGGFGKLDTPQKMLNAAAEQLAIKKAKELGIEVTEGMTQAALKDVIQMSKSQLAGISTDASRILKDQLRSRDAIKDILKSGAAGTVTEGATEAVQELIGYTAAHIEDSSFDFNEALNRMTQAAVAGAALGGSLGTASGVTNQAQWEAAIWGGTEADGSGLSDSGKWAEEERRTNNGFIPTIDENLEEARRAAAVSPDKNIFNELAEKEEPKGERTKADTVFDVAVSSTRFWRGSTRFIFLDRLKNISPSIRKLAASFGGGLQTTYSGNDFESFKHLLVAKWENAYTKPTEFYSTINGGIRPSRKKRELLSRQFYNIWRDAVNDKGVLDTSKIPEMPNRELYIKEIERLQRLSDSMLKEQQKYGDVGEISNYFSKFKSLNKNAVAGDRAGFITALMSEYGESHGMTEAMANDIATNIIENPNKNDIDGLLPDDKAFSVTDGTPIPGSHRARTLGLSENPAFDKFLEQDIFTNVNYAIKSAARFVAYQKYVGINGSVIAAQLEKARAEGVSEADLIRIAKKMKDYLDAESGNYKRATTDAGKLAQKIQKNFLTFTILGALSTATVSSTVELMLLFKGLTNQQIFGKGGLKAAGVELGTMFYNGGKEIFSTITRVELAKTETNGQRIIQELGYNEQEAGAASKTGVTETNALKQNLISQFFKWNGLQGWTQMTRAVRASIAWDYMLNHAETIYLWDSSTPKTKAVEEAEEHLRNLHINVELFTELAKKQAFNYPLTEVEAEQLRNEITNGTFAFINDAIMMPTTANRPMIYHDPRFAMFTQFSGFIAVFQSTFIPKLWGEYVKRGSPQMKYHAFSMMVLMIAMGYASQELKDRMKWGTENPYLDDMEKARRAVSSSGLLGTGQRVIDFIAPMYESRSQGYADWAWNKTSGEAPALGTLDKLMTATGSLIEGDYTKAAKAAAKLTPLGSLPKLRDTLVENITQPADEWGYNKE
mgnify:CR=1 FL=1